MVKTGYKQTEIGVIPEDWEVVTLSVLCRSICDGTHFTPKYVHQGIPFYSVENITANDFTNTRFISQSEHEKLIKRCKPERGDILMTRITAGIIGDTRILDWDVNASIYVSLALLKLNERIVPEYLYCYSKSSAFVRDVEKMALVNATPKKINMQDIGAIPIPTPKSTDEQRAIAAALSDVDALIASLDKLIAKKRAIKTAAMQQLLTGKTRLPGFGEGKGYKQTEVGVIPEDWEVKRIKDLELDISDGNYSSKYPRAVDFKNYGIPFIRANNIKSMKVDNDDMRYITSQKHMELKKGHLKKNDILITTRGDIGNIAIVPDCHIDSNINAQLVRINTENSCVYYLFLAFCFISEETHSNIMSLQSGSALKQLPVNRLMTLQILLPSLHEQQAIAEALSDMDAEIAALETRRNKTQSIKQGMMQELLTGRTRLV